jgi:hypothetical protein
MVIPTPSIYFFSAWGVKSIYRIELGVSNIPEGIAVPDYKKFAGVVEGGEGYYSFCCNEW